MVFYVKKLELKNFKAHKDRKIEFSPEKNLILGENGVGKSSIFHAILISLFGHYAKSYIGVSKLSNLIRHLSPEARVRLVLSDGSRDFIIERNIRGDSTEAKILTSDGKIVATGSDPVTKKILEITRIKRANRFLDILYVPQGKLGEFVDMAGKKELTERIESIFGIKEYSVLLDSISKLIREINYYYEEKKKELIEKERRLKDIEFLYEGKSIDELKILINKKKSLEERLSTLKSALERVIAWESTIDRELLAKKDYIAHELDKVREKLKEIEEQLVSKYAEKKSLQYDYNIAKDYINSDIETLRNMLSEIIVNSEEKNIDILKKEVAELKEILDALHKFESLQNIPSEYNKIKTEIESLKSHIYSIERQIRDEKDALYLIESKKLDRCPVCGSPLSYEDLNRIKLNKEKLIADLEIELKLARQKLHELSSELQKLESMNKEYEYLLRKLNEKGIDISNISNEKARLKEEISRITDSIRKIEEKEAIENAINYLQAKEIEKYIRTLEDLKNKMKVDERNLLAQYNKIKLMENNLSKISDTLNQLGFSNIEDLKKELSRLESEYAQVKDVNEREIQLYLKYKEDVENLRERVLNIGEKLNKLNKLKRVLEQFVAEYRKDVAKKLSISLPIWFKRLYKYTDILDIKLELKFNTRTGYIFTFHVLKNIDGKHLWKEISEAGLSGGQKKIIDLAIRLALIDIINPDFRVLLLDEPTESLDENVRINLAEIIDNLSGYQVILCTHDDLFKDKVYGNVIHLSRSS